MTRPSVWSANTNRWVPRKRRATSASRGGVGRQIAAGRSGAKIPSDEFADGEVDRSTVGLGPGSAADMRAEGDDPGRHGGEQRTTTDGPAAAA